MAKLIWLRHEQSLWNAQNKFTGWVDMPLSERGREEANIASCQLREKHDQVDICFPRRSLVMDLDNLSPEEVTKLELAKEAPIV